MARSPRVPKLCVHKASGLAYATDPDLKRPVYFGRHGTQEAEAKYQSALLQLREAEEQRRLEIGEAEETRKQLTQGLQALRGTDSAVA